MMQGSQIQIGHLSERAMSLRCSEVATPGMSGVTTADSTVEKLRFFVFFSY